MDRDGLTRDSRPIGEFKKLILGEVVSRSSEFDSDKDWVNATLEAALGLDDAISWRCYQQESNQWRMVGGVGLGGATPLTELLSVASCQVIEHQQKFWCYFEPIQEKATPPAFLIGMWKRPPSERQLEIGRGVAEAFQYVTTLQQSMAVLGTKAELLTQLFEEASAWHLHHDTTKMLDRFARVLSASLDADRASIFLWDKASKQLVGYPALGVEGGELRISDKSGIVGACLQSHQAKRWDSSDAESQINRRIDQQTGYNTRSLLAVPVIDSRGAALGVLELINHRSGAFSAQDEGLMIELAKPISMILEGVKTIEGLTKSRDYWVAAEENRVRIIGHCPAMEALRQMTSRVAATDLAIMILGENGTGKEVVAKSVHLHSQRRSQPFVAVNCAAIAETLLESELFGHEKGAFTDAMTSRAGKFELAAGGTLFLDEIGDMSLNGQSKLLRVLEEKLVVRVGGSVPIETDVRVIAATNQNLMELVATKRFREDLFFRLNVVTLRLPPLRERGRDVIELADFFLDSFCQKVRRAKPNWTIAATEKMLDYHWPGNVRELRNMMERLAYLHVGEQIEAADLEFSLQLKRLDPIAGNRVNLTADKTLAEVTDEFQVAVIQAHITAAEGNISLAAQTLGLHRSNLYRKMRQLGMNVE